jgi:signal transduction histidine kinase
VIAVRGLHGRAHEVSPLVVDGLLALAVAGAAIGSLVGRMSQVRLTPTGSIGFHGADGLGIAVLLVGTLSLAWRRRAPLPVLVVSGTAFFLYEGLGYAPTPLPFAPLMALYTVAARCPTPASVSACLALSTGVIATGVTDHGPITHDQFLGYLFSVLVAWMLGYGVRLSRTRLWLLEQRASGLVREQADRTRLAVEQEQARIARELHDIVAHNVSVIVAQATAARRVFDTEPEHARQVLGAIETTARQALVEMRRLLGVLHPDPRAERAPQPGLDQLPGLVAQIGRAGLPVELVVQGRPRPLPAGVELSAYRIVQEALTNALKHAGAARATVVLGYCAGGLELRVSDDGRGAPAGVVAGQGLVGMGQRAALLGGQLVTGPGPQGGFQVTATLPDQR